MVQLLYPIDFDIFKLCKNHILSLQLHLLVHSIKIKSSWQHLCAFANKTYIIMVIMGMKMHTKHN